MKESVLLEIKELPYKVTSELILGSYALVRQIADGFMCSGFAMSSMAPVNQAGQSAEEYCAERAANTKSDVRHLAFLLER